VQHVSDRKFRQWRLQDLVIPIYVVVKVKKYNHYSINFFLLLGMRCIRLCECVTFSRLRHVLHLHEICSPHCSQIKVGINLVPHARHDSLLNKPGPYPIKNNCPNHRKDFNFRHIMGRIPQRGWE
jgi:hypothetical protein